MQTRTRLSTPPGQEPTATASSTADEVYVPGLALPDEPAVPGRHRRLLVTIVVLLVLAAAGYATLRIMTAGESFDPALDPSFVPGDTDEPEGELPDT